MNETLWLDPSEMCLLLICSTWCRRKLNSNHSSSSSQKSILWIKLLNSVAADGIFFFSSKTASNTAHR